MRILSDSIIEKYLTTLTREDVLDFQKHLLKSLTQYEADSSLIPQRIVRTTDYATHLFMPGYGENIGIKVLTGSSEGFNGVTMIIDPKNGEALGLLNARNLTAFRTALATSLGLIKFFTEIPEADHECLVFGSGLQAYWHVRLLLLLFPNAFSKITIANRSQSNAQKLQRRLHDEFPETAVVVISTENEADCSSAANDSTVIFGCTGTTSPVLYNEWLKKDKRRFVGIIGSYKPHMTEVDSALVFDALESAGFIVVDSVDHVAHEAGEIIQNEVAAEKLLPISKLTSEGIASSKLMLYKLVGLSIMDTSVGAKLLENCAENGLGYVVDNF